MTDDVENRVALVTGGSRGIGRAIVEALLEEGWVMRFCSRSRDSVETAAKELNERYPGRVDGRETDVRSEAEVQSLIEWALESAGRLDCLVNNAGIGVFGPVDEITGDQWREVLETNLSGTFYATRAAAPIMKRQGSGWILNIASLAGKNPFAGGSAYNASKFGMVGLSEASMLDLRHHGIRVAAILPGSVRTEFSHPSGRPSDNWRLAPEDIARVVVNLLAYPDRALPSLVEIRPSQPPKK
ncbi:MAG: SDR family oxidoreductase [Acidobacteria bacterium]|nr:MAG: SDR family oxidoreductase [Acidobacteriota bacterium]